MGGIVDTRVDTDTGLAWVTVDNPPVNATSTAVRQGLLDAVTRVQGARLAILRCAGRTFIAGGDMREFDAPPQPPDLPDVVDAIEASATPFVAVMQGTVLGGGLEIAMGCAYRIAAPGTRFGLPEVTVGLIPGAGGTQRAPRLFGWDAAIDMACAGKLLSAQEAHARGALDAIADDPEAAARALVPEPRIPVSERPAPPPPDSARIAAHRRTLAARARGQTAPLQALDALLWATGPFREGQRKERALHLSLRASDQSRALRHAFFAERTVARPAVIRDRTPREIARIAVMGGGLMGAGIAAACLGAGYRVDLLERDAATAEAARDRVRGLIAGALRRGKIDQARHDAHCAALRTGVGIGHAAEADLAIEAVFEETATKRAAFAALAQVMAPDAILATNTSYLDPREIFAGIPAPDRCLGLHFFAPAHVMKLLEVVRLPETSAETLATAFALAGRLRKVAVLSGICDGFIGNRMLAAYRRAAEYMLADGALPEQIDGAMRAYGMAMGPFEAQDLSGLHIAEANRRRQDATRPARERYVTLSDQLCALGRTGQRAGKGWYAYAEGDRRPRVDPAVTALITDYSAAHGLPRRTHDAGEIQARLLAVLANEGARLVEEGIADSDAAVDMVKLHGYGFPRWRGGPLFAARQAGDATIRAALDALDAASPGSWVRAQRYR
ncbi:enoyl-CoA hydratase (PaaF) and 3-hydroxyacyl-CoA dehydrogenase (PaaH) fusion protein (plasmid) [Dinoroseobacter shibae DFL 12 = DSM 16493]|uniref:Enoyl-CoA hydratase (PaaF) and 3-hydroxyacyl-CoA dehydrogenase (PaaH) fusion protein n=1 Tax=Dinoroseobacter shibae (strain DSM 16493 / NCIMB 14021 / DFL 12) TaxID=398580 RepID=A8LTI9_DINSH|nr:3-hydroxyacyl-CoA dehydrogenase NAD-binding domain-containing protein [Dinoroseobacter shibae]ABV95556.1 enoyl-CoA hydratase (PaaF) and 3-hydroxyacyl-CoA dehydrogenase (PaaH) fusion protein [Dinoroseobacter shibae DFL 12 = DSM 16493]URF48896.1 3-hydroxyacyl-CoA dehydrogenase NAD-binding domain-containing protein [Dinoroseobacter shibae]URF53208.1 3-hydroxyacyl-CoA dehydrogenase NAD-binding domain-containing protein [Dinoroseobacter shibae]